MKVSEIKEWFVGKKERALALEPEVISSSVELTQQKCLDSA